MIKSDRIRRLGQHPDFYYQDGQGSVISDSELLGRIKALVIPPGWQKVEISKRPGAKIQATGYDSSGRRQYIYNPSFRARRDQAKFERLLAFAEALPAMRRTTGEHLRHPELDRDRVLACMVRLIDTAYFRVGNEKYALENQTFGLTTLRPKHLHIEGDRLVFHYVGKSHKEQTQEVIDHKLAQIVRELDELPSYEVFKYYDSNGQLTQVCSQDLNAYIHQIMGGQFTAKDFRTWAGTLIAAVTLAELNPTRTPTKLKTNIHLAVKTVAAALGNTPAVAKSSYIAPSVVQAYLQGQTISLEGQPASQPLTPPDHQLLASAEVEVIKLLKTFRG